jgi:hypothetical protein
MRSEGAGIADGNEPGKSRPPLALLSDPGDLASDNGWCDTCTIVAT